MVRLVVALPFAAALLCASAAAQPAPTEARVDSVFADVDGPTRPGCAVSVMRDGAPIYERGYGMANLEHGIPITPGRFSTSRRSRNTSWPWPSSCS